MNSIKTLVSITILELICMGAAGADTPNLASAERQSDGSYKVVCLDGTKETLTEKQFKSGYICSGLSISEAYLTSVPVDTEVEIVTDTIIRPGISALYFSNGKAIPYIYNKEAQPCEMHFNASNHERLLPKGFVFKVTVDAARSAQIYVEGADDPTLYARRVYFNTSTSDISSVVCSGVSSVEQYVSTLEYPSIADFYRHFAGTLHLRYNPKPDVIH